MSIVNREDAKIRVQQATDIVGLIGEQVALKPRGKEYVGLCPFHDDTNPSMYVVPAKQIYHCFSCGAGGDCFSFVMDYHKMSFPEALRHLADRAGIDLPAPTEAEQSGPTRSQREQILAANGQAMRFFRNLLAHETHGQIARDYLARRGINDEMIEQFQIGYAPDRWDGLTTTAQHHGWPIPQLEQAGLLARRRGGEGHFDRFRHRLIFPIFDAMNRPIAFGGRILPGGTLDDNADAKYLNSPENAVFNKSATLYGMNRAKQPIIKAHTAVIVEGYTDVIAAHRAGFENVVATLGTALTRDHARVLRHLCEQVVLVFDADEAGQNAADRALEVFFREPLDVKIAILPDGKDPDDLLGETEGADQWRQTIDQAEDAIRFTFKRLRDQFHATDTMAGRQKLAEQFIQRLAGLGLGKAEPARRAMVLHHLSDLLRLDVATVDTMLRRAPGPRPTAEPTAEVETEAPKLDTRGRAERMIVGCLISRPSLFHAAMPDGRDLCEAVLPGDLTDEAARRLYEQWHGALAEADADAAPDLRSVLSDEAMVRLALDLRMEVDALTDAVDERVEKQLIAAYRSWRKILAEQQYQWQKMQPADDSAPAPDGEEARRLARAIEIIKTHPDAGRVPRITR